ncbi:MAG: glutathione S-transferase N-terminal domain-containing protein [Heliobacteriaceae bacterium]|jgi:glutaredoxin|nr:glutathione S-transferase N-terminal domain-containing protein [Heliobacteriaceae bacterium]
MLELFVLDSCPYCRKVTDYMKEHNIACKTQDITVPENLEKLLELGGEKQVPFLYDKDNNVKMYESDDIIKYLKG